MGKLQPLLRRKVIKVLIQNGFSNVRSGKHTTFKKHLENGEALTTWIPHHKTVTVFVLQYIIKQTRKPREEFEI